MTNLHNDHADATRFRDEDNGAKADETCYWRSPEPALGHGIRLKNPLRPCA